MPLHFGIQFKQLHKNRHHQCRQPEPQQVADLFSSLAVEVAQQALVEGGLIEGWLQVDRYLNVSPGIDGCYHAPAQAQDDGPRQPEMGEQHLTKFIGHFFSVDPNGCLHILQAQPLHLLCGIAGCFQGYQRLVKRHNAVPGRFSQLIAIARGACRGVGFAPGGHDDFPTGDLHQLAALVEAHPAYGSVSDNQVLHPLPVAKLHLLFLHPAHQGVHHICGQTAHGKDPVAAIHKGLQPLAVQQGDHVIRKKGGKSVAQEAGVGKDLFLKFAFWGLVGDVAMAFSCDEQLPPGPLVALQHKHPCPRLTCTPGR